MRNHDQPNQTSSNGYINPLDNPPTAKQHLENASVAPTPRQPFQELHFSVFAKRITVIVLVSVVVIFLLKVADVLPPFIWATVVAYVLNHPLSILVSKTGWPRWTWAVLFYVVFFGVIALALFWLIPNVGGEAREFVKDAPTIRQNVDNYLQQNNGVNVAGVSIDTETAQNIISSTLTTATGTARDVAPSALSRTARFLIDFVLFLVVTFYLMLTGGSFISNTVTTLPLKYRREVGDLVMRIDRVLSAYIRGQFILIGIMTTAAFIVLTILGVHYSFILAIMTGVLELVPFVGPYSAIVISSAVAFFQPHGNFGLSGLPLALIVAALYFTIRQVEDYVVVPAVIGKMVELPSLVIIFVVLAGSALLGPMGLLLGVPITAAIKIVVGYLYYKLVDADREKLDFTKATNFQEIAQALGNMPNRRVLVEIDGQSDFFREPANLAALKQLEEEKEIDIAVDTDDEKLATALRKQGIPVLTMEQEHFVGKSR